MIEFRTPETPKITHLNTTKDLIDIEVFVDCQIMFIDHENNFGHSILKDICFRYIFYINDQVELGFNYVYGNVTNTLFVESLKKQYIKDKLYQLKINNSYSYYSSDSFSLSLKLEYLSNMVLNSNNLIIDSNEFKGILNL
jgi:hypothetical protein